MSPAIFIVHCIDEASRYVIYILYFRLLYLSLWYTVRISIGFDANIECILNEIWMYIDMKWLMNEPEIHHWN